MDLRRNEFDVFEKGDFMETIQNVEINQLHDFKNHPFKVEVNTELCELMKSIEKEGVLVPLLVRTNPYGDGYEVISGHRRKEAAVWAGEMKVPVVIRELDDDQAVVAMVDSNLHRENLKYIIKSFSGHFRHFITLSSENHILFAALVSTVFKCFGNDCGMKCGRKNTPRTRNFVRGVCCRSYVNSETAKSQVLSTVNF